MVPVIYLLLAIICYTVIYRKYHDSLHPIGIMTSIWFFTAAIGSLKWGYYQGEWLIRTHLIILLSGMLCFYNGGFLVKKRNYNEPVVKIKDNTFDMSMIVINNTYIVITRIVFLITLLIVLSVFMKRGMNFNYFKSMQGADMKTEVSEGFEGVSSFESYFLSLLPFCSIFSFFELLYAKKRNKSLVIYDVAVIVLCLFYCIRIIYSRGTFLYVFLGYLYIFNSKFKIKFKYLAAVMIGTITLLGFMMMGRMFEGSIVFSKVNHLNNPVLTSSYNYIAYCFENLDQIMRKGCRWKITANTFQTFYKLIGMYSPNQVIRNQVSIYNAITWLSPFYDDLGIFGVLIYPSIISFGVATIYNNSLSNRFSVLFLAVLQKAIFITFFGNYFLTSLSIMFPYLVTLFICISAKKLHLRKIRITI